MERDRLIDLGITAASAVGLWYVANMALSKRQRKAIIDRDDGKSQMRHYSEEDGWHTGGYCQDGGDGCNNLHVHHIVPQRAGGTDNPSNLITLYECEHVGRCKDGKIKPEVSK